MRAGLSAAQQVGVAAQVGAGPAVDVVVDGGVYNHGLVHGAVVAHRGVLETAVGANGAGFAHRRLAPEEGLGKKDGVLANGGLGTNPHLVGIKHRDAGTHEILVDAALHDLGDLCQLDSVVDA